MDILREWFTSAILPGVTTVLVGFLTALAAQYIAKIRDERLRDLLLALVAAAEQIYGAGKGTEKKAYVKANAPAGVTDAMIEAAVYDTVAWVRPKADESAAE